MYNQIDLNYVKLHQNSMLQFGLKENSLKLIPKENKSYRNTQSNLFVHFLQGFRNQPGNLINKLIHVGKQL